MFLWCFYGFHPYIKDPQTSILYSREIIFETIDMEYWLPSEEKQKEIKGKLKANINQK